VNPAISDEVQMGPKTPVMEGDFFRQPLREQINLKHPLVRQADLINWERLGASMIESFVSGKGRPATSPRLIAALLYLQHAFDLSDEESSGNGSRTRIGRCSLARLTCRRNHQSTHRA
jgi:IS5 family transposase